MAQTQTAKDESFDPENPYALTQLERQVVDLLIGGLTGEEVGDLLGIERRGVALKRASAMRKFGARNGMHLAHLIEITRRSVAADAGLVVLEDVPSSLTF
jgi:DNA-binding CsgD family transcriptional regulator